MEPVFVKVEPCFEEDSAPPAAISTSPSHTQTAITSTEPIKEEIEDDEYLVVMKEEPVEPHLVDVEVLGPKNIYEGGESTTTSAVNESHEHNGYTEGQATKENISDCGTSFSHTQNKPYNELVLVEDHDPLYLEDEGPISCKICSKHYKYPSRLKAHMEKHQEKRFSCGICGKQFKSSRYLQKHEENHLENKLFGCKQCNKHLTSSSLLNEHEMLHIDPFRTTVSGVAW